MLVSQAFRGESFQVFTTVHLVWSRTTGKLQQQSVAATTDCSLASRRLFVTDRYSGRRFLIDTGSDLSCLPRRYSQGKKQPLPYELLAANGTKINTFGLVELKLNLGLRRDFAWKFIVAEVGTPIIGSDFLAHYHLLPDCAHGRLRDDKTGLSAETEFSSIDQPSVKLIQAPDSPYSHILTEFPSISRPPGAPKEVKHTTVHFIKTTDGPPVTARPRRLAPLKLRAAQTEFEEMIRVGTARPSSSSWSSPLHLALKKDETYRPCGDYRALNARTIPDCYPVRHIGDFGHNLSGCSVFSTLDLVKAYQQIPVNSDDICKTAIITPFGLYEFPYMTFGLRNAGQTFQRFIDEVVRGFNFCFAYVDDILVYSRDPQQHAEHLRLLFHRLHQYGVVINPAKCVLGAAEVTFLGYRINAAGTFPPEDRIRALVDFAPPKTVQGVRRFLGMVNYYRRFLPDAAKYQAPLIDAVAATNSKGAKPFPWTPELEQCFDNCKKSLANVTTLSHPNCEAPLGLFTDASSMHVGACLQQKVDDNWQPLAYFSKKLTEKQSQWPAYYRELLAVYESVQHFRHILEVQNATVFTDHKPLVYAFTQRRDKLPPTQLNQLTFISQFTTDIRYIKGTDNVVADAMSRVESISLEEDYQALAESQERDEELKEAGSFTSLKLRKIVVPGTDTSIICDTSTGRPRPYLTLPFRRAAFDRLHGLSHPGVRATLRLVAERYVWPHINTDCRQWAKSCLQCQRSKVTRHTSAPLMSFPIATKRFCHVHIDIIGPLPPSDNFTYCLTAVDRFTRWPEAWPMTSITAEEVADTLVTGWISRFGVPSTVTTDQGRQFESALFRRLMNVCATKRIRTTSYHPCANGMVERMHRQLKASLMCHPQTWSKALPLVLLGMRTALKEDLNTSSAELVYGEPLRLPGELIMPAEEPRSPNDITDFVTELRSRMEILRPIPASRHARPSTFVFKDLATSTHVLLRDDTVRRPLQPPYTGPYRILRRRDKTLTLEMNGREATVSIDRVKPAYLDSELISSPPAPVPVPDSPSTHPTPFTPTTPFPSDTVTTRAGRRVKFRDILDL